MSDVVSYLFEQFDPEAGVPRIDCVYVTAELRELAVDSRPPTGSAIGQLWHRA